MPGFEVVGKEELAEIADIFERANGVQFRLGFDHLRNGVFKVNDFEKSFATRMQSKHALAVTSGTAALKVALKALGVGPGDEVITQAFTFVATVEAIVECGAIPVITQIDSSLTMCPTSLASVITNKTKAIIPVHMLGVPCDMKRILSIATSHKIPVIEDTAWGCGGYLDGKPLGSMGDMGCFSFDNAKTMTTGEGGMIITNSDDLDLRARAYHDHGHENNPSLKRWEDSRHGSGFNYRMTEMQGAFGLAQLKKLDSVVKRQKEIKEAVDKHLLQSLGSSVKLRPVREGSSETADAIVFSVATPELALNCRAALLDEGLGTKILPEAITWHFAGTWNHIPELVSKYKNLKEYCKPSEDLLRCCVSLPVNLQIPADFSEKIVRSLKRALS